MTVLSERYMIDGSCYPVKMLGDLCKTTSGGTLSRGQAEFFTGNIPWIKSGELNDSLVSSAEECISDAAVRESSTKALPAGTLIVALYGATVGKTGVLAMNAATNQAICAVFPGELLTRDYVWWFLRYMRPFYLQVSKGGAQPNISQKVIRDTLIPVPPLSDQHRIVARVEELAARIEQARGLRRLAITDVGAVVPRALAQVLENVPVDGHLADILIGKPKNGWSPRCDGRQTGVPVLSLSAVTGFEYREDAYKWTSEPTVQSADYWLREGDLLITRSNTSELVGHAAIYNGFPSPCIYPDLMMRLAIDESRVSKSFVHKWLRSEIVREYIRRNATGSNPSMKKISQEIVTQIPFPTRLSLSEQQNVVKYIECVQVKAESLKRLQAENAAELGVLLPTVLGRAFRGEL